MVDVAGGGLLESIAETVQAAGNADEHIDLGDVAINAAAVGLDALAFIANPVDALGSSAIAFVIEHLAPLRAALDWTTGDPDGVQNATEGWNDIAVGLDTLAGKLRTAPGQYAPTWINGGTPSATGCAEVMTFRSDQIYGASMACVAIAQQTAGAGTWVAAARGVIRDLIAGYVWELVQKAIAKLAVAPFTLGASMAEFVVNAVIRMSDVLRKIGRVLSKLLNRLTEISTTLSKLGRLVDRYLGMTLRTETNVVVRHGTLLPNVVGMGLKFGLDWAREETKVDHTQTRSNQTGLNQDRVDERHRQHDAGVNEQVTTDAAKNPDGIEETPPGFQETEDWWTRKGTL